MKKYFWQTISLLYAVTIFINENFLLIQELGLSTKTEKIIKVLGAATYFLMTYFNFKPQKNTPNDNK